MTISLSRPSTNGKRFLHQSSVETKLRFDAKPYVGKDVQKMFVVDENTPLNPWATPFTLNPHAKPFVPASASTSTVHPTIPPATTPRQVNQIDFEAKVAEFKLEQLTGATYLGAMNLPVATIDVERSPSIRALLSCAHPPDVKVLSMAGFVLQSIVANNPNMHYLANAHLPIATAFEPLYVHNALGRMQFVGYTLRQAPMPYSLDAAIGSCRNEDDPRFVRLYLAIVCYLMWQHSDCSSAKAAAEFDKHMLEWWSAVYAMRGCMDPAGNLLFCNPVTQKLEFAPSDVAVGPTCEDVHHRLINSALAKAQTAKPNDRARITLECVKLVHQWGKKQS